MACSIPNHWLLWVSHRVSITLFFLFVSYSLVTSVEALSPSFILIKWHHLIMMAGRKKRYTPFLQMSSERYPDSIFCVKYARENNLLVIVCKFVYLLLLFKFCFPVFLFVCLCLLLLLAFCFFRGFFRFFSGYFTQ